jgi:N-acyl-D-aspartate/D-glutamate deacylase
MYDLIVKSGMIVDGTGFPRYRADVGVKDGRIAEIGRIGAAAERTIDADGLFVSPGVVDLHTHYDAQPFWDRLGTSSIWHGVTTTLIGNCGLTLAPLRPEHREPMLATFCCVEDLPLRSLSGVLPWTWQTFGEYLDAIDIGLGLNMMPLVGHNPLRLSAMDKAAWDRPATEDETRVMQDLLRAAMEAGAWGWSTTNSPTHAGPHGEKVPSRLADDAERVALGRTLAEFNRGIIEILPPSITQPDETDRAHLIDVAKVSGRPVFFLVFDAGSRGWVEAATREGARLQALLRAIPNNPRFTLKKTTFFTSLDVWDVLMSKPAEERLAALADPVKRAELREAATKRQRRRPGVPGRFVPWASIIVSRAALPANRALQGRKIAEIAEERGTTPADVMLDLAREERLETEFQLQTRAPEEDVALAEFVRSGLALPSQSDAGAHLNTNYCTAGESSYVLGQWVRERGLLSLEDAIRRYTFQPARLMGLRDRGLVREGLAADLMVFDLATIGVKEDEVSRDGPGGTPRRVQGAEGIHQVIVGGQVVLDHGRHTGALPGRVLRSGR